jgi:hypothetical protein
MDSPLQWLYKEIPVHVSRWTLFHAHFICLDSIRHEEVPDVDVTCPLAARPPTVVLQ